VSEWIDCSSYSQSEPHPRTPRSFRLDLGRRGVTLIVTRFHGVDGWVMHLRSFHVDTHQLRSTEIADAKAEALRLAHAMLTEALAACVAVRGSP